MTKVEIEAVLNRCEAQLTAGSQVDLKTEGFWKAVNAVKRDPQLVDTFADQMGRVDRHGFENWVRSPSRLERHCSGWGPSSDWR